MNYYSGLESLTKDMEDLQVTPDNDEYNVSGDQDVGLKEKEKEKEEEKEEEEEVKSSRIELSICQGIIRDYLPADFYGGEVAIEECLEILHFCAQELNKSIFTSPVKYLEVFDYLRSSPPHRQASFLYMICKIFNAEWAELTTSQSVFWISPVLWLLQVGPMKLAEGLREGKSVYDILVSFQREWVADRIENDVVEIMEYEKEMLQSLSDQIYEWGMSLAHNEVVQ